MFWDTEIELKPVVCYMTKQPIEGTNSNHFLAYYHNSMEEAIKDCEKLNAEHPATLWNGLPLDWNIIDHFYVGQQEKMGD